MNHNLSGRLEPGKNAAVTSLIMGLLAMTCLVVSLFSLVPILVLLTPVCGILGLVEASKAKRQGYCGTLRTLGFSLSLIGVMGGILLMGLTVMGIAAILSAA